MSIDWLRLPEGVSFLLDEGKYTARLTGDDQLEINLYFEGADIVRKFRLPRGADWEKSIGPLVAAIKEEIVELELVPSEEFIDVPEN